MSSDIEYIHEDLGVTTYAMLMSDPSTRGKAHRAVASALQCGALTKYRCEICASAGSPMVSVAHHADYEQPLDVIWLCAHHHQRVHAEMRKIAHQLYVAARRKARA